MNNQTILITLAITSVAGGAIMHSLIAQPGPQQPRNEVAAKLRRLAAEIDPVPMPPMPGHAAALANVPAVMPSPMVVQKVTTGHPSGWTFEATPPPNTVCIYIPEGYALSHVQVGAMTLEQLVEIKRTNSLAEIYFFTAKGQQ